MFLALIAVVLFIAGTMAAAMVLIVRSQNPSGKPGRFVYKEETVVKTPGLKATYRRINDLIRIEMHESGIFSVNGVYVGLARLSGTNFDVMSEGEQNAREDALIGIQNQINYPVQYITSTVIADTDKIADEIRANAESMTNEKLARYSHMYAQVLDEMKRSRHAMAQVTWIAVSDDGRRGNPVENIRDKMLLLQEAFRGRAGVILVPVLSLEESLNALKEIMLPERLSKPSDMLSVGGLSPIKFNIKEIENIA
ncbi:MAG: hypothetical protein K6T65_01115 [Peptococcaceae bacterium]|nr:hypothetical protein [Peptococcaceae bacterium]